jgi:hypothetical protein
MTNYAGDVAGSLIPQVVNERTGTGAADAVPGGAVVVWRNTGVGSHTVTVTTNNTAAGGLAIADLAITLAASQVKAGVISNDWVDVNGFCAVAIDATAAEVRYYVLGGI